MLCPRAHLNTFHISLYSSAGLIFCFNTLYYKHMLILVLSITDRTKEGLSFGCSVRNVVYVSVCMIKCLSYDYRQTPD